MWVFVSIVLLSRIRFHSNVNGKSAMSADVSMAQCQASVAIAIIIEMIMMSDGLDVNNSRN